MRRSTSQVQSLGSAAEKDVAEGRRLIEAPQPESSGLEVSDLRKSFRSPEGERIEVLRGVNLSAGAGEMIAITGASGSGKSTLLQLIGGLDEPDHGTILLNHFAVTQVSDPELEQFRRRNIGFVFQFHHLLLDLTAVENVALPLLIARAARRDAFSKAGRSLETMGLGEKGNHPVGHLSGGEQQRVALARALITEPALILADEPTGNLDSAIGGEIAASLLSYCRLGHSLAIVATHNRRLARFCDRILTIQNGKLHSNVVNLSENSGPLQL